MVQVKFLFHPGTYIRLLSYLLYAMLCCFGYDNEQQQALELQVCKLREENATLKREYQGKTQKLEQAQKQHKKLEKKVSELEKKVSELGAELQITAKSHEAQTRLSEELKKRLLSCDEQVKVFNRQNHTHEVEIQYSKQQFKRADEENCKLREQISRFTSAEEHFRKRESEYKKIINKLRQDLHFFVKQDEIRSEENLTLTKKFKELEAVHSLEKQKNIRTYSQQDLSNKNTNSLDYLKSTSLDDLDVLQQTAVPYIPNKQDSDSGRNIVNEKLQEQIEIFKQQLLEEKQQNTTLNLEKAYYDEQIIVLQNELVGYKQKVNVLMEQIGNLNKISSIIHPETEINRTAYGGRLQSNPNAYDLPTEETLVEYEELDLDTRQALKIIAEIYQDSAKLEKDIEEFSGVKEDKQFLHLNELLMRNVVKLDNVESGGQFVVREKRKEAIQYIQKLHTFLNDKVK